MFRPNEIRDPHAAPSRKHFSWQELEEYHPYGGMWSIPRAELRAQFVADSAVLMMDTGRFLRACETALAAWPRSALNALTNPGLNHRAWTGHAACWQAVGSPEETTRLGWHQLDERAQRAANAAADTAITRWMDQHLLQRSLFDA